MADKLYVYRHGWDTDSLGSETVKLFSSEQMARNCLEKDIREYFECSLEDLIERYEGNTDAIVTDDYVEVPQGKDVIYYIIEKVALDAA